MTEQGSLYVYKGLLFQFLSKINTNKEVLFAKNCFPFLRIPSQVL